jgi:4-carboxymuconolactone decarboxylase
MANGDMPADVYADSFCRLPMPDRDKMDERGQTTYDRLADPNTESRVGLQGPATIQLHSAKVSEHSSGLNRYLRTEAGFDEDILELAILVAAREMDSKFEWTAHEPAAIEAGVPDETIDVVRFKKSTDGLSETEILVIEFGRQLFRERRVDADRYAAARALFGDRQLVDFVVLMTQYSATALVLRAFDMQPKAGLDYDLPTL